MPVNMANERSCALHVPVVKALVLVRKFDRQTGVHVAIASVRHRVFDKLSVPKSQKHSLDNTQTWLYLPHLQMPTIFEHTAILPTTVDKNPLVIYEICKNAQGNEKLLCRVPDIDFPTMSSVTTACTSVEWHTFSHFVFCFRTRISSRLRLQRSRTSFPSPKIYMQRCFVTCF